MMHRIQEMSEIRGMNRPHMEAWDTGQQTHMEHRQHEEKPARLEQEFMDLHFLDGAQMTKALVREEQEIFHVYMIL